MSMTLRGLAALILATGLNMSSATEVCPLQLAYTIKMPGEEFEAALHIDFEKWTQTNESRFELVAISHYGRHPRTETALVVFDFEHATPFRMREDEKGGGAWVTCHYDGTDIQLIRQLPDEISYCQYDGKAKALECLYHAPSEPESVALASPAGPSAVLVVGSVRECRLEINGIDVGLLRKNRDRAFYVVQGEVLVKCAAEDGLVSQGNVNALLGKDTSYRVVW